MTIHRLKTLIAIAESGTFAAAADVIHVSQAAVSQQMKSLEDELQVTLFDRTKRPPELNQLGLILTAKARELVRAYDGMLRSLQSEGAIQGQLLLGAVPTTLPGLIPRTLGVLKSAYPDLHIRIVPGLSSDLMAQVDRSYLDAAVISEPSYVRGHMEWRPFAEEPLVLLAPLQSSSEDPFELLEMYPYIRFSRRAWVGDLIDRWLASTEARVNEAMELDTLESVSAHVYYNLGVSIVPLRCVPSPHPLPLKRIPLGPTSSPRILGVISRRDCANFRMVNAMFEQLQNVVEAAGQVQVIRP